MKYAIWFTFVALLVFAFIVAHYGWFIVAYAALTIDMVIWLIVEIKRHDIDSRTINKG